METVTINFLQNVKSGQLLILNNCGKESVVKVQETTALYVVVDAWPTVKFKKADGWPVSSSLLKRQRLRLISETDLQDTIIDSVYRRLKNYHKLNVSYENRSELLEIYHYFNERNLF